jgi:hypothetical protein
MTDEPIDYLSIFAYIIMSKNTSVEDRGWKCFFGYMFASDETIKAENYLNVLQKMAPLTRVKHKEQCIIIPPIPMKPAEIVKEKKVISRAEFRYRSMDKKKITHIDKIL